MQRTFLRSTLRHSYFMKMKNSFLVFKMCSEVLKSDFLSRSLIFIIFLLLSTFKQCGKSFFRLTPRVKCPFAKSFRVWVPKNVRRYSNFAIFAGMQMKLTSHALVMIYNSNRKLWTGKIVGIHKNYSIKQ
jgi:hypothetical protein